ncbi:hypothetical protein T08_4381 [Trichinella sp. T8]|nr:hypothetical protein T08_4381 [Trichinella sp. T8]
MRSTDLRSGLNGFDDGVRCSGLDAEVWSLLSLTWRAAPPAIERTPETFASCLLPRLHPAQCWCPRPLLVREGTCPATSASGLRSRVDDRQTDLCLEQ